MWRETCGKEKGKHRGKWLKIVKDWEVKIKMMDRKWMKMKESWGFTGFVWLLQTFKDYPFGCWPPLTHGPALNRLTYSHAKVGVSRRSEKESRGKRYRCYIYMLLLKYISHPFHPRPQSTVFPLRPKLTHSAQVDASSLRSAPMVLRCSMCQDHIEALQRERDEALRKAAEQEAEAGTCWNMEFRKIQMQRNKSQGIGGWRFEAWKTFHYFDAAFIISRTWLEATQIEKSSGHFFVHRLHFQHLSGQSRVDRPSMIVSDRWWSWDFKAEWCWMSIPSW